jgi:hypothetical protein
VISAKSQFPELYQFFAGYFYQGWVSDYRWDGAEPEFDAVVRHFRAVNPPAIVETVRNQLDQLILRGEGDDEALSRTLSELGNGFNSDYEGLSETEWLRQIAEVLSESAATSMVLRERF